MPDASRRETQRQAQLQLHERFRARQGTPLAVPGTPEIIFEALPETAGDTTLPGEQPTATPAGHSRHRRQRSKRRRNLVMLATVLVFVLVVLGSVFTVRGIYKTLNPDDYTGPGGQTVELTVEEGWGVTIISRRLAELDVVASDKLFVKAMDEVQAENKEIHPGTYVLPQQIPASEAVQIMIDNRPDKVFYVGLSQNMRLGAALEAISEGSGLDLDELTELANQPETFGLPAEAANLEGYLYPAGYRFAVDTSAREVLARMVQATEEVLAKQGINDPAEGYRVLKIASILQAEAQPRDYAIVAGALNNRLATDNVETHGLLQVDSTVIYGLDRYTLQFSAAEKADAANPYNTYVHPGLPPGPIGSPAESAIAAAVNPQDNGYYYWVTVNISTGETKFARSYDEHRINQQEFRDWCQANQGVCQ
ncbi:endolytic transglycosylase MltG [Glutamicibacter sp. MNS18]|uniref:endolytic transglycosylase MltG n=1 Tax=Glutamicibacter sp. MNS18 TaxID=2989817 RepID=UPI002236002F|nr:endolytic transglycosylase MltG [Glutamicibacter sp. MNS18]MCW4464790.1 endolytic transglycosylase MltG [Glutamicibacter sp. MNS18]